MSCRTRRKASRSWTRPCPSRPAYTMVSLAHTKKHANQSLLPGSSPGGLCGAPSSAGEISVQIFSKKYCFSKFSFSGQRFHQKQTPGSIPGDAQAECQAIRSFIHACLVSSSSKFLDRLCHIRACNLTVNSPSDQVILSSCKHLLKYQSIQFNKI